MIKFLKIKLNLFNYNLNKNLEIIHIQIRKKWFRFYPKDGCHNV